MSAAELRAEAARAFEQWVETANVEFIREVWRLEDLARGLEGGVL